MLGDTAVAINGDDPRYAHLHGCHVVLPLLNKEIPIAVSYTHLDVYKRQESACRFEFEIHHFIYFPTPLYTKARFQSCFCVCWGFFLFEKSSGRQCTRPIEQLLSAATPPVKDVYKR